MRASLLFVIAITWAACGGDNTARPDGAPSVDGGSTPADAASQDSTPPLSWVDFAASGCTTFNPAGPSCQGTAPLRLRFVAIAPTTIDTFVWSFGDGTPTDTEPSPLHQFEVPGVYQVALTVGGLGGTAQAKKDMFVTVVAAPLGNPCGADAECASTLSCTCAGGAGCPASLAGGFCSRGCSSGAPCGVGAVCADLAPPTGTPASWQRALCLVSCSGDGDCAAGFACRELHSGSGSGWVRGCFAADLLADEGASCDGPDGQADPTRCAGGACADYGARGLCAQVCDPQHPCPSYATCAHVNDGSDVCVARCGAGHACTSDPWLDCEAPQSSGTLGFSVNETPATYCAPKRCSGTGMCGADGTCTPMGGASFCTN